MELASRRCPVPLLLLLLLLLLGLSTGAVISQPKENSNEVWGYLTVRKDAHMFWWLYYAASSYKNFTELPLIMWLQGGPGGSSTGFGNFEEIGLFSKGPSSATLPGLLWVTLGSLPSIRCSPGDLSCTVCLFMTKVWQRCLRLQRKSW
uniref:Serine carboxypeptidase 1 n=1 Tax=Ovis aries TaxID=9940 RepID=A0AC11DT59_SHEEP